MNDDSHVRRALAQLEPDIDPETLDFGRVQRRIRARARQRRLAVGMSALALVAAVTAVVAATRSDDHGRLIVPATTPGTTAPGTAVVGHSLIAVDHGDLVRVRLQGRLVLKSVPWLRHTGPDDVWLSVLAAPDGHTLIATRVRGGCAGSEGNTAIYRLDVDAPQGAPDLLANFGDHVVLSADGTRIAYHGWMCEHDSGVFLTDLRDGSNSATSISTGGAPLAFSPDSRRVLVEVGGRLAWLNADEPFQAAQASQLRIDARYVSIPHTGELLSAFHSGPGYIVATVDPVTGKELRELFFAGASSGVNEVRWRDLAVDPAGTRVAVVETNGGIAPEWSLDLYDGTRHPAISMGFVTYESIAWVR